MIENLSQGKLNATHDPKSKNASIDLKLPRCKIPNTPKTLACVRNVSCSKLCDRAVEIAEFEGSLAGGFNVQGQSLQSVWGQSLCFRVHDLDCGGNLGPGKAGMLNPIIPC